MDSLQPIINLLVVLSVLSMGAERATNLFKLHRPHLRDKPVGAPDDPIVMRKKKERERDIAGGSLLVGILLSLAVKADFF